MPEDRVAKLIKVIERLRDCEQGHPFVIVAAADGGDIRLTYGDLVAFAEALLLDRKRANDAARSAADALDLLDTTREALEEMRERYADMCSERDALSVELDYAHGAVRPDVAEHFHHKVGDDGEFVPVPCDCPPWCQVEYGKTPRPASRAVSHG